MFPFQRPPLLLALAGAIGLLACGPRVLREPVYDQSGTRVLLRSQKQGGKPVPRGFTHPAIISSARLAHILSRVDVRLGEGDKAQCLPAVPIETLYEISDGLSQALAKANPDQEAVVLSLRRERRFGFFTQQYLTSLLAYVKGDSLYLHFDHVDWQVPKGPDVDLPEPRLDRQYMKFRVLPETGLTIVGPQAVSAVWRDDLFREPARIRVGPGGRVQRRTILLDSPEETGTPGPRPLPSDALSPQALRRLADLEEARRRGELTEAEYQARRRAILRADPSAR